MRRLGKILIRALLVISVVLIGTQLLGTPPSANASDTLYEYYNTGDDDYDAISSTTWFAQTLTPSVSHTVTSVKLLLFRSGTPGTITVYIETVGAAPGYEPTGVILATGTSDGDTLTTNTAGDWREILISAGADLSASTKYAIVLKSAAAGLRWREDVTSPTYAGGAWERSTDSGATWTGENTSYDFMFEEYGTESVMVPGLYVIPAMSNDIILDNSPISGDYLTDQIVLRGSKGESIPVRLVFQTAGAVNALVATASNLTSGGNTILASNIDIKHIQTWYQFANKYHPSDPAILTPELLLNDKELVRVSDGDNEAYVDGSWVNLHGETTLAEDVTDVETDWTVTDGTQFPTSGYPYYVSCESEIVSVADNTANVLTVVRAQEGSTAVVHVTGKNVTRNYPYPSMYIATADFPIQDESSLQPVNILANNGTQLWVTVNIPAGAVAGIYIGTISLDVGATNYGIYDITLTVLPFDLEAYPLMNNLYYDGTLNSSVPDGEIGRRYKSVTQLTAEYQDMFDHGINYPMVSQSWDNVTLFNQVLDITSSTGFPKDKIFLMGKESNLGYGYDATSEELLAITAEVEDVIDLVQAKNFTGDVYFYGIDEAGSAIIAEELDEWEAIHDGGGKVFVAGRHAYMVTGGGIGVLDLLNDSTETGWDAIADAWHAAGGQVNQYSNPQGGFELPLSYRRYAGLQLWQADLDGIMDWQYQGHYGRIWEEYSGGFGYSAVNIHPYAMTYPTIDGVVDTIEWAGWQVGLSDSRYVKTLEVVIATTTKDTTAAEAYLANLKTIDLTTVDLDEVREDIIDFILDLNESTPLEQGAGSGLGFGF